MTINEENKIEAKIGHPRLFGGNFVNLNMINFDRNISNDISYIPISRRPNAASYYQGPETRALDKLAISNEFTPTSYIRTQGDSGGETALPDSMVVPDADLPSDVDSGNLARVGGSYSSADSIDISEAGFDTWVHLGATKLFRNDAVIENTTASTTLTEGTDYEIDYHEGRIKLLNSAGSTTDNYLGSYSFKNTSRNIAYSLSKLPKLGGSSVFIYGIDSGFTGENKGFDITVFINDVDAALDPNNPDEAEVTLNMREAVLATVG